MTFVISQLTVPTNVAYGVVVVIFAPLLSWWMWRVSRPHNEKVEDSNALAATISAIGDAAVHVVTASTDVSEMMHSFLTPLRKELEDQKVQMIQMTVKHNIEIDSLRKEFTRNEELNTHRVDLLSLHVRELRRKMRENQIDPGPAPDLEGFQFD